MMIMSSNQLLWFFIFSVCSAVSVFDWCKSAARVTTALNRSQRTILRNFRFIRRQWRWMKIRHCRRKLRRARAGANKEKKERKKEKKTSNRLALMSDCNSFGDSKQHLSFFLSFSSFLRRFSADSIFPPIIWLDGPNKSQKYTIETIRWIGGVWASMCQLQSVALSIDEADFDTRNYVNDVFVPFSSLRTKTIWCTQSCIRRYGWMPCFAQNSQRFCAQTDATKNEKRKNS